MPPPNTLFIREVAQVHASANFLEIMEFLSLEMGLFDIIPGAELGGDFMENPRYGQISAGFEIADVAGTLTTSASATTTTALNERMVVLHRMLFHSFFESTTRRGSVGPEGYSAEVGRQFAIKAAQRMLTDIYNAALASAAPAALDHEHDVYNVATPVTLSTIVIQNGKFKMTDHMETLDIGVVNSKQWNDLRIDLISNDDFRVPNIVGDLVRGQLFKSVMGITFIVDDQIPTVAGSTTSVPRKQRGLFLRSRQANPNGEAPIMLSFQRPLIIHEQHVLGQQSREDQMQAELAFALGFRGSQWDSTNGGVNPSDAALALSTNWDESNDDDEQHGIVSVLTN